MEKYYVTGNTAEGFVNLIETNIKNLDQVIVLNTPSNAFKTKILKNLIKKYETDHEIEILCSAHGNPYLDGIIIRETSIAILCNEIVSEELEGNIEFYTIEIDLPSFEEEKLQFNELIQKSHENFKTGLQIHDDLEEIYINEMNFERADQFTVEFIDNLLNSAPNRVGEGMLYHRLFGTNTPDGIVNVVPHLIKNISNVHYIKGRAGTGKSTFMKKIAKACTNQGLDVELYHCSFDPNSIDMVLVRELDFCIFDSTDPHEFFPERNGDVIVDLYEELVTPGTDETYEKEITELNTRYKSYMKKGIENLKAAGRYLDKIEQGYTKHSKKEDLNEALEGIVKIIQ